MPCSFLWFHLSHLSRSGDLLKCYISALLLAFLLLVIIHMSVLHAYVNFASELMRFADRQFYSVSDTLCVVTACDECSQSEASLVQPMSSRGHTPYTHSV